MKNEIDITQACGRPIYRYLISELLVGQFMYKKTLVMSSCRRTKFYAFFFFSYDNILDPVDHITCAFDLRNEKRHLFEIPNPHSNLDLDEYEYEDDFE